MRRIFILAGIITLLSTQNSFAIPSYDEAESYHWLSERKYNDYIVNWHKYVPNKEPGSWQNYSTGGTGKFIFDLKVNYEEIYQFRSAQNHVFEGNDKDDYLNFFALPRNIDSKNVYIYSTEEWLHLSWHGGANYYYFCSEENNLCYFAAITKLDSQKDNIYDFKDIYLQVKEEDLNSYESPNDCDRTGEKVIIDPDHTHIIHDDYRCSNNQCWEEGGDTNCWDAHTWYEITDGNVCGDKHLRERSMCAEVYSSGNGGGNGKGGEDPNIDPYDPWEGYKNAIGIYYVRASEEGEDDWENTIEVPMDDIYDMDFRIKLKQKGGEWPYYTEAFFYLSNDDVFDTGDILLGSKYRDLTQEEEKKKSIYLEDVDMADYIDQPGEYYVFVAVDYINGINRSNDKDERVKIIVEDTTPLSDGTFIWSPNGAVPGMTCTQWKEPADPHSWGDNFLCTTRNEDIRWSADGPIAGMRCTQIYESQDPHFQNNYLCVPNESALNFVWSESGNMSDMYCVRTDEPKDKHSWDDNYLCWSDSGANGAGNSGIYYGSYDTVTTNTGATSPDVLPASIHLNDASGNIRAIYTPAEVPGLPDIAVRIENIGAVPSSSEQKHKLKTSVVLTGPGYESGWKFTNTQTQISGFGTPGYAENMAFALPSDAVFNEGLYSITVSADETDKLTESNELNNTSPQVMFWVQNALPDIAVQSLSVDDDLTEVEAGSKHDITIDVGNIAPVGGDAHFPVLVQLWYDGDQLLGEQVIEAADLIAGGNIEVTISGWTVPFEEGEHTLTATATNKYVSYEANLSNNILSQDITIIVTPGDPNCVVLNPMEDLPATGNFDMAATSISFPDTLQWGESLHPKATNCTLSGSSPKTRAMWAYARCDGTGFTHFDGDSDGGMRAGECEEEQVYTDRNLSTMDPGMYMIYFISNGVSRIPESDYSNNVQAKAFLLEE
ncbi:MAG: hypothetical protein D3920_09835 [Candidatus Electrothrix sp. AW2]|nr:hypothetical protein [Candidatus Electrothrix gigas]